VPCAFYEAFAGHAQSQNFVPKENLALLTLEPCCLKPLLVVRIESEALAKCARIDLNAHGMIVEHLSQCTAESTRCFLEEIFDLRKCLSLCARRKLIMFPSDFCLER
jgi:hypothetical protein